MSYSPARSVRLVPPRATTPTGGWNLDIVREVIDALRERGQPRLFITNITTDHCESELEEAFSVFGRVEHATIRSKKLYNGDRHLFAFVQFQQFEDAAFALFYAKNHRMGIRLPGHNPDNVDDKLQVNVCRPPPGAEWHHADDHGEPWRECKDSPPSPSPFDSERESQRNPSRGRRRRPSSSHSPRPGFNKRRTSRSASRGRANRRTSSPPSRRNSSRRRRSSRSRSPSVQRARDRRRSPSPLPQRKHRSPSVPHSRSPGRHSPNRGRSRGLGRRSKTRSPSKKRSRRSPTPRRKDRSKDRNSPLRADTLNGVATATTSATAGVALAAVATATATDSTAVTDVRPSVQDASGRPDSVVAVPLSTAASTASDAVNANKEKAVSETDTATSVAAVAVASATPTATDATTLSDEKDKDTKDTKDTHGTMPDPQQLALAMGQLAHGPFGLPLFQSPYVLPPPPYPASSAHLQAPRAHTVRSLFGGLPHFQLPFVQHFPGLVDPSRMTSVSLSHFRPPQTAPSQATPYSQEAMTTLTPPTPTTRNTMDTSADAAANGSSGGSGSERPSPWRSAALTTPSPQKVRLQDSDFGEDEWLLTETIYNMNPAANLQQAAECARVIKQRMAERRFAQQSHRATPQHKPLV